jgi:demethylmenaquinone methyltransferase/2-methoxy-6-polyprenyl-1,4-benzoquinol methylase
MSLSTPPTTRRVAPHAPLEEYYESEANRHRYVVDLFDRSAPHYDTIEKLFLNFGLWYRRFSLRRAGLARGMRVLDVAMGTGAVARGAARLVGPEGRVFGVDPSRGMIREARRSFRGPVTRGVAGELPFRDESFDFVTMGIALRHVADLDSTFRQYFRVLRPGGTLWILEGYVPTSRLGHGFTRLMWERVVPGMTLLFTRSRDAKLLMDYYWDTIDQAASPETLIRTLEGAGFERPRFLPVPPVCEYVARKPGRAAGATAAFRTGTASPR